MAGGVTVLAGRIREVDNKKVVVTNVGGTASFSLDFDYGFPLLCKVGDEISIAIQVVTPIAPPAMKPRRKFDPDLEKGRPSIPGAK